MMYFHVNRKITFLIRGWSAKDTTELAYYVALIFALAVIYECLRGLQKVYMLKACMPTRRPIRSQEEKSTVLRKRLVKHVLATLLYIVQVTLGYMLMLLVMTYNYVIFVCTILGITFGYYLAEPLIVRGVEYLFVARMLMRAAEEQTEVSNGHGKHLLDKNIDESSF